MNVTQEITTLFVRRGDDAYFGECVSMTEHCLQAAHFADIAGVPPPLIVAALLHDVGHLIDDVPRSLTDWVEDAHHERVGGTWLASRFGPEVSEPVRLHVPAKRYLCATDTAYLAQLSPASLVTLELQGGPMSALEVAAFEQEPYHRDALVMRRCDDKGKVAGLVTPVLADYRRMLEGLARPCAKS